MKYAYPVEIRILLPIGAVESVDDFEAEVVAAKQDLWFALRHHTYEIVED